jgi:hypothetical protein
MKKGKGADGARTGANQLTSADNLQTLTQEKEEGHIQKAGLIDRPFQQAPFCLRRQRNRRSFKRCSPSPKGSPLPQLKNWSHGVVAA